MKQLNTEAVISITLTIVSIFIAMVVFSVALQMKKHNKRMTWFLISVCSVVIGLSYHLAECGFTERLEDVYFAVSHIMYALVAPFFCMYFIETEEEEDKKWDAKFWITIHGLISFCTIILSMSMETGFQLYLPFMIQYVIILIMLLFSSKDIRKSIGFIIGSCFVIAAALAGMAEIQVDFLGFATVMMLMMVFFLYQIDTERELMKNQMELSEQKVALLTEQMHPHFIYNALQQIALLCDEEPGSVKGAIYSFSGYLRNNLESLTNEKMIPFSEEMEHTDTFIELAKVLPSKKFEVEKDFQITDFNVPALVVQPLVENAIKYGIGMSSEGDKVVIQTMVEKGYVLIKVKDNGHGERTELPTQKKRQSVGTKNVRTRLSILCDGELSINKTDKGTEAVIKIPEMNVRK